MMCSTKPLVIHLIRGVVGLTLIIAAIWLAQSLPLIALLLGAGALVAFRGCPTCWIAGLFEVISLKKEAPQEVHLPLIGERSVTRF